MDKNTYYLKPHSKIQTSIRWKFCGRPSKRTFFKIQKKIKLELKKRKIKDFKIYSKMKIAKKVIPAIVTLVKLFLVL